MDGVILAMRLLDCLFNLAWERQVLLQESCMKNPTKVKVHKYLQQNLVEVSK